MEGASKRDVLSHLSQLEEQTRSRRNQPQQHYRVKELKAKVEALMLQRDQLKAEIHILKSLHKLRSSLDGQQDGEEEESMDVESENPDLLQLMGKHIKLRDLLHAHHLIGGYDIVKTRRGRGACLSLPTAYEGVCLDTYNLEMDLKPVVRINHHNIPPFIPLSSLAEQSHMQTNLRGFLDTLSRHLNAFAGRKQQLKLIKEQHKSVEVMESNVLCSRLVLMFTVPKEKQAVLCVLEYTDHTRCLPTRVHFQSNDEQLLDSPPWTTHCTLLQETPLHKALTKMKESGCVV